MDERVNKLWKPMKNSEALKKYVLALNFDNGEGKRYNMGNKLTGIFGVEKKKIVFSGWGCERCMEHFVKR